MFMATSPNAKKCKWTFRGLERMKIREGRDKDASYTTQLYDLKQSHGMEGT